MNYKKLLRKINRVSEKVQFMDDSELKFQTELLRKKIEINKDNYKKNVEEEILIEAFAVVREVDRRILKLYPTDEQVLGAIVLYQGRIAEIKTGEGKSLVATMPLYLKALYMGTVFLVTTNDYLAKRDYERIGEVYKWLGLRVSEGTKDPNEKEFKVDKRKGVYSANIIYISNSALGFDFLINALAEKKEDTFMAPMKFAILDEVDEILLDSAQMPLIISGAPKVQSNYFEVSDDFVRCIKEEDYKFDEERVSVWLTSKGIGRAKRYFSIANILDKDNFDLYRHIILALKAQKVLKKGRDYIIDDGKVKLLDRKDGRVLEGSNLQSGLHQAIQTKEGVEITPETQTVSSITYQNLFRHFQQLAGMSGTAKVAEAEFIDTYNLPVKKIETHKKNRRVDHSSKKYVTFEAKIKATLEKINELHAKGRPILIISDSLDSSELLSMYLLDKGISHNLLNAKSSVKEAQIIREAGRINAVTVSTAMSGRGTDIKLTKAAVNKGGLAVIITERMSNQRIEMQAKGRAGRQGEPGDTYVFESLEDEVIKLFIQPAVQLFYEKKKKSNKRIKNLKINQAFNRAQKLSEEKGCNERIKSLEFDEILVLQKKKVDESREKILSVTEISEMIEMLFQMLSQIALTLNLKKEMQDFKKLNRFILDNIDYGYSGCFKDNIMEDVESFILQIFTINLEKKRKQLKDDEVFLKYLQITILKAIDTSWSKQVNFLNQLRYVVQSRVAAQKNPLREYEDEARRSYDKFCKDLPTLVIKNVALSMLEIKKGELIVTFP